MPTPTRKMKVCVLVNMIAPARIGLFSALAEHFDLLVSHGGVESNRDSWGDVDQGLPKARVKRAWGWQVSMSRRESGNFFDHHYVHIRPGYAWHLLKFRPDAVITGEMGVRTLMALSYGALFRKPVWVWWGGTLHTERKVRAARRAVRWVISRWARHWISYGRTSTEYLVSLGVSDRAILEIQNAVDERRFTMNPEPAFKVQPRPVLLHVGQLIPRKGIDLLFHAAAALQNEGHMFSLLLVGSGREQQALEQLAKDLGLRNLHFRPSEKPEKMPSVYRSGDVLIFPTLEDVWGLVANEAILCGLPVLCSQYAGCARELFPPQSIFDPKDATEFRDKLRKAVAGQLPKAAGSCLRTTPELANDLIRGLERSMRDSARSLHHAAQEGFTDG